MLYLLILIHSRTYTMADFHPGPYIPNQGNGGWLEPKIEEEPEEEPMEDPEELEEEIAKPVIDSNEEDLDESDEDDSDAKSKVINPPYMARVPAHMMGPNGPMPPWAHAIWRWSRHQAMRPPFGMDQRFYDLRHREPADRALPVMVRRTRDIGNQAQATVNQMDQM